MSGRPLRIAMTSYYLPSDSKIGVGYQVHELAQELSRRGHHVEMFSECGPVDGRLYVHHQLHLTGSLRTFRWAGALRRLDLSRFDVLHAHGDDYWMWRRRVPVHVRTLHGSCFEEALRIRGAKERSRMVLLGLTEVLASVVADETVAVSPVTRRWTPWVRRVIPNGVDRTRFRPRDDVARAADPTVLFVGTWGGRKRGADLAAAFADVVRPALPGARLRMVCRDAPEVVTDGVDVLGRLSDEDLAREYASAWVFCLPSSYEGFGIPYAEALASGLPVVATPNVGARYVLDEGRAGILAEPGSLGEALLAVLTDSGRAARLAERALARAEEFDLGSVTDRYEALYAGGMR